jgi:hypothetical protein
MSRPLLAVLCAAVVATAGCGADAPAPHRSPADPAVGRERGPEPRGCTHPGPAVTVTAADDGGTVCLTTGGRLTLALTGAGWRTPTVQGDALTPAGPRAFTAVRAGKAILQTARPSCPAAPGVKTCHSLRAFTVRVVVN